MYMLTHNRLHDHLLTHTTLLRTHFDCVEGNSWHIVTLEMLNGKYFSVGRPKGSKCNLKFQSAMWPQAPS